MVNTCVTQKTPCEALIFMCSLGTFYINVFFCEIYITFLHHVGTDWSRRLLFLKIKMWNLEIPVLNTLLFFNFWFTVCSFLKILVIVRYRPKNNYTVGWRLASHLESLILCNKYDQLIKSDVYIFQFKCLKVRCLYKYCSFCNVICRQKPLRKNKQTNNCPEFEKKMKFLFVWFGFF